MNMKRITTVIMIFFFLVMLLPQGKVMAEESYTLTLKDAIELTLKNSPDLKKADVMVGLAERGKMDTSNLYDDIKTGIQAGAAGIHQKLQALDMQKQALLASTGGDPEKMKAISPDLAAIEVQRQGLVYSLGSIDLMTETNEKIKDMADRAEESYEDAKKARDDAREKIKFAVEKLYLAMLNLDDFIKLQEANVKLQKDLTAIERLKYENGLSTAVKVDKGAQKVMDEEKKLRELENTRLLLRYQMNRNIGRPWDASLSLAPVAFEPVMTEDMKTGYENAVASSLAIEQYNRTIKNKNEDLKDSGGASDVEEKLQLEISQAELNLNDTKYKLKTTLEKLHYKKEDAQRLLIDAQSKYNTARVEYEETKTMYEQEMALKITVDASRLALDKAYNDYVKAVYDYYLAARELQLAQMGIILD
jgi:hypothetical protein